MSKIIPIQVSGLSKSSAQTIIANVPSSLIEPSGSLLDTLQRPLHDLRISVTDRCNFRCPYCMPKEIFGKDHHYLGQKELLTFEEISRLTQVFIAHGVKKIRLTGGEPLLRKGIEDLVSMLSNLRSIDQQPLDLTLTTNGSLLGKKAQALKDAGLKRITISLDGMSEKIFRAMNDVDFPLSEVLASIDSALAVGFESVKINMVVKKGVNDQEILPMIRHFKGSGVIPRFIEYMDVGNSNGWRLQEVLSSREVIDLIQTEFPITPIDANYPGEVAQRWKFSDQSGEFGVISSVTNTFCHDCTRARLSMEGKVYLCLFANQGFDLRSLLRSGADNLTLSNVLRSIWSQRTDRYSELRSQIKEDGTQFQKVEMSYIGG